MGKGRLPETPLDVSANANSEVAEFFESVADLLELKDDNPFKIRAYRRAARNVRNLTEDIRAVSGEGRLKEISGIGKDLAAKIEEILKTGKLRHYEKLKRQVPQAVIELMSIPGVGPRTAKLLHDKLKVRGLEELEAMARRHKISGLPGVKDKTEENILRGIELVKRHGERMSLKEALQASEGIIKSLGKVTDAKRISPAGSLRRMKDSVRDIDILAASRCPEKVMDAFTKLPIVGKVLAHGQTKSSILTKDDIHVDVRVVKLASFGAALVYFTGSEAHNIRIRHIGRKMGFKVNEYGVFNEKTHKKVAGKEEADVYRALGLPLFPPELREDRGEIEAGLKGKLPDILELEDIKGDLHVHSKWSDGANSIKEIAEASKKIRYEYVAVTDHSETLKVAGGMTYKDVIKKLKEIEKVNRALKGLRVLSGAEVEIRGDGTLDYGDDILKMFDVVIAAIHSGFKESREKLTERILRAIDNRRVNIIAHPTGKLRGVRDSYNIDFDRIFKAARDAGVSLEINSNCDRLDLDDINSFSASRLGVKLAIGTDSHYIEQLGDIMLGVSVARRAWLTKRDVVNTLNLDALLKLFKR